MEITEKMTGADTSQGRKEQKKKKEIVAGRARGLCISRSKTEEATGNGRVALKSRQSASHHSKGNHLFLVFFSYFITFILQYVFEK